jgi:sugar O-acyltransferase (sialic acid O-acetyltransferase NeuD family)
MPTKLTVTRPADFIEFQKQSILQGIHQRIEEQVRLYPSATALKSKSLTYTYTELNGHANSVAHTILAQCGKSLAQVALLLPNTAEMIIGMLGTLKAHKAYVPLDGNYPVERLRAMFEDAEPSVLLTDDSHYALAEELAGNRVSILNTSRIERNADAPNPRVDCDPLDRAYILFTSGTTGRPKGIVFLHRNLLHTTMCLTNELFFSPSDRVTWLHSPSFGSSIMDIYCSLTNGAALYPWDPKVQGFSGLAQWLVAERMTTLQWLPSAFRQFMRTVPDGLKFEDIRIAIMAGEPLTMREVELFRGHFAEGSHLVNQTGTAESYNYYLYRVDHHIPIEDVNVPGGYPVSSERKLLILDDAHNEVPEGSVGEIAIQSDYMSGGYWRDEAQTRAKFIRVGSSNVPAYLTGDLGRCEPDGCLIHLGRKDFQFKIRGCRIEPADVEYVLTRAPGIADCACWFAKDRFGENQLVGYVVLKAIGQFNQREVEEYLEKQLPSYMVPRTYVLLDSLPALPNGKANRKALPDPFGSAETPVREQAETLQNFDQRLMHIFKEILQTDQVTLETDFLEAGGDSLSVAVLQHRIHECFGINIAMDNLHDSLTPARLSGLVASTSGIGEVNSLQRNPKSKVTCCSAEAYRLGPVESAHFAREENLSAPHQAVTNRPTSSGGTNLVIVGAGQSGREVFTWATQAIAAGSSLRIKGFLDDNTSALEAYDYEPGVLGDVHSYLIDENDVFVSAIGDPVVRAKCCTQIEQKGGHFVNIIHPLANIGLHVELGVGIVMGPFSSITSDAKIGNHTSIGAFSNVAHDTVIGECCQISSHCGVNGCATLGEGVFLGSHACILPRVTVGSWAFVGAGSIVVQNVNPRVKVFGNPAAAIGRVGKW